MVSSAPWLVLQGQGNCLPSAEPRGSSPARAPATELRRRACCMSLAAVDVGVLQHEVPLHTGLDHRPPWPSREVIASANLICSGALQTKDD